ncbi:CinA family protein [Frigoribacterium sp. PvP032]|uniref:CinA family protein n=1 Tax=Frigoribacterium sp. PvP032 TaxID=2806589 RepID=UPI001AE8823F|nr:CinA family protein [Frigoribacterium sp. PvP032]MBP1191165.1 nicotinamide-nucleotide amidase [Frigoribacterium sp. PvP032]
MTTAAEVVHELDRQGLTVAVAESLTGGLLAAELISVPGASAVVVGGVVAYQTPIKHLLLDVPADLLAARGAVDPDVAVAMASGVRRALAVDGRAADVGLATTGVAGPDPQDGEAPGTVYVALSAGGGSRVARLDLEGDREAIRSATVSESLSMLHDWLTEPRE